MSLVWYPAVSIMLIGQASLPSISRSVNQKNSPSDVQRGSFLSKLQDIISHKVSLCYGIQENISPQGISIGFWYWLRIKHFLACFFPIFLSSSSVVMVQVLCTITTPSCYHLLFYLWPSDPGGSLPACSHQPLISGSSLVILLCLCCCLIHHLMSPLLITKTLLGFLQLLPRFFTEKKFTTSYYASLNLFHSVL